MTFVGLGLEVRGRFFWETGHRRGDGSNSLTSPSWNLVNMELVKVSLVTMSFMRVKCFATWLVERQMLLRIETTKANVFYRSSTHGK